MKHEVTHIEKKNCDLLNLNILVKFPDFLTKLEVAVGWAEVVHQTHDTFHHESNTQSIVQTIELGNAFILLINVQMIYTYILKISLERLSVCKPLNLIEINSMN